MEEGFVDRPLVLPFLLGQAQASTELGSGWRYLIRHVADAVLIGLCCHEDQPDGEGIVELGYGIAPAYRGQGLGAEAVAGFVAHLLTRPRGVFGYSVVDG